MYYLTIAGRTAQETIRHCNLMSLDICFITIRFRWCESITLSNVYLALISRHVSTTRLSRWFDSRESFRIIFLIILRWINIFALHFVKCFSVNALLRWLCVLYIQWFLAIGLSILPSEFIFCHLLCMIILPLPALCDIIHVILCDLRVWSYVCEFSNYVLVWLFPYSSVYADALYFVTNYYCIRERGQCRCDWPHLSSERNLSQGWFTVKCTLRTTMYAIWKSNDFSFEFIISKLYKYCLFLIVNYK